MNPIIILLAIILFYSAKIMTNKAYTCKSKINIINFFLFFVNLINKKLIKFNKNKFIKKL